VKTSCERVIIAASIAVFCVFVQKILGQHIEFAQDRILICHDA
jgi:hypothetical protein